MDFVTERELEVADVLWRMPEFIKRIQHIFVSGQTWGAKRRRSALTELMANMPLPSSSPPLAPALQWIEAGRETEKRTKMSANRSLYPLSGRCKKAKNRNNEKAAANDGHASLIAGNNRLQEMEPMSEKKKKKKKSRRIDQGQQQHLIRCRENRSISSSLVVPLHPTTTDCQPETSGPYRTTEPENLVEPVPLSLHRQIQPQIVDAFQQQLQQHQQPAVGTTRPLVFGDTGGRTTIPDLNASVDDNGSAVDLAQSHQEKMMVMADARKLATAVARKKRIEIIYRRKVAAGGGGGAKTGVRGTVTVGIAA